jgi:hypothetical protein
MLDIPIACIPSALTGEERARSQHLRTHLASATSRVIDEVDGYSYEYPDDPELLRVAAEWIVLERRCCPFMSFELRWPSGDQRPTLRLSGPPGVKEFLQAEMPDLPGDPSRAHDTV